MIAAAWPAVDGTVREIGDHVEMERNRRNLAREDRLTLCRAGIALRDARGFEMVQPVAFESSVSTSIARNAGKRNVQRADPFPPPRLPLRDGRADVIVRRIELMPPVPPTVSTPPTLTFSVVIPAYYSAPGPNRAESSFSPADPRDVSGAFASQTPQAKNTAHALRLPPSVPARPHRGLHCARLRPADSAPGHDFSRRFRGRRDGRPLTLCRQQ